MKSFKDIVIRAFKTFIQAFIAVISISIATTDLTNKEALKALIIGAIASGISALMNYILNLLNKSEKKAKG